MRPTVTGRAAPPTIKLVVLSGPDAGLERAFELSRVTLGRGSSNDLELNDGFVSNFHAELVYQQGQVIYRDLKSRHGSLVCVDNVSYHLHNKDKATAIPISSNTELQIGCTLIQVVLSAPAQEALAARLAMAESATPTSPVTPLTAAPHAPEAAGALPAPPGVEAHDEGEFFEQLRRSRRPTPIPRETMITSSARPVQTMTRQFETTDKRLGVLFRLASQLNGLNQLEDILDKIVEAAFDAFHAANFFSMTLTDEETGQLGQTVLVRHRRPLDEHDDAPVVSQSILKRVVETRESVLFVKDSMGMDLTQSIIDAQITACLCAPLVGQRSLLGVMEVDTRGQGSLFSKKDLDLFSILASLAAFALERARLSNSIVEMFESFVHASVNAIEGRDPTTAGHSERVALYTMALAEEVNTVEAGVLASIHLNPDEMTELRYAALLHDFGKIAVREDVLQKGKRLPELHLELIAQRFETIKALAWREHVQEPLERAILHGPEHAHELGGHAHHDHAHHDHAHHDHARHGLAAGGSLGSGARSALAIEQLEARYEAFCQALDAELAWMGELASVGFVHDEALERLKRLAARQYRDRHGHVLPYLTPYELENLSIRRGTLNEEEWENMRSHAAFSRDYLARIPWSPELRQVPCIAGDHHEKLDGTGYPRGLLAPQIVPQVRMLTIADIFDALTASDRPYRKAAPIERALSILEDEVRTQKLDGDLVDLFARRVVDKIKVHIPKH